MKTQLKRLLSGAIALIMVLSLVSIPATALDLTLQLNGATVTVSDADQTVDITLEAPNAIEWCSVGGDISVESPLSIADIKNYNGVSIIDNDFSDPAGSTNGYLANMALGNNANVNTANLVTVTVKIPANTVAGDYEISFEGIEVCYDYGEVYTLASDNLTATITVSEVAPATQGYELYYVLDKTVDTEPDRYIEYNPGETVTATIYLKSNLADTLQAIDLYVTNDTNLTYTAFTSVIGAERIESGTAASTATSQHLQVVGADKDHPINVALPAGEGVEIATITFTVADTAVYNTAMPITLTNAANIAVAGTPASFSPELQVSSDTLGVETLKTYTISYNDNVADEEITVPADQTKQHGVDIALDSAVPTRTGYTFAGWTKTASSTTADYAAGATFSEDTDTTLYAVWTVNTHKVTWKSQDGTQTLETDENVPYGEALSYDGTTPTKEATAQYTYTFVGWSITTDSEVASAASPLVMLDNDMVLYAAFSKVINKYTVTWYKQDGSAAIETDTEVEYGAQPSYDGTEPTKDADETYTYEFAGWATSANQESGSDVANLDTVDGDENYYAAFTPVYIDYSITYDLGAHPASTAVAPTTPASAHYNDSITLPAAPAAAEGYTFTGWSDGNGNTYAAGDPATITATTVFTAQYSENKYDVVYDANGGTGTLPANHEDVPFTQTITIGSGENLTNNGYTFIGWNTDSSATTALYSAGDTPSGLSSTDGATVTLYAIWSEAAYVIEYNYDGADTPTPSNVTAYDVSDLPITLTRPTKTGYTFDSWTITVKSGEEGSVSASGDVIAAGTWGNLTVKANWTPNTNTEYTVKHRFESLDGTAYVEDTTLVPEDDHLTGTTGQPTAAAAKTITGYTAKDFEQVAIAADGSTVIVINYDRNKHTVTYKYAEGTVVPSGAPDVPVDANSPYKFGATVNVDQTEVTVPHYDFSGWQINGSAAPANFTMGDENVEITGSFTEHSYTIKFWNLEEGASGNTVLSEQTYTESTQGSVTDPTVPTKEWYDANGWTAYTLFSAQEINVYPQYTEHVYTITFQDENGDDLPDQGNDNTFTITDKTITPPDVPEKPGYDGAWPTLPTDIAENAEIQPVYTPHGYTITFVTDGGDAITAMDYNIESTDTLPTATGKTNFSFTGWLVTIADGNWAADSLINGGSPVTGKYGNVTLTAQWEQSLNYAVQEYKYAAAGYKMLIIDAAGAGEGKVYTYDGATMYYTTDENYQIGTSDNHSTAVFYTLIEADALTLTDAQVGKIAAVSGSQSTITYDGDVNGDGKINIADANAIFQMVVATGSYYGESQLTVAQRLAADMVKATDNAEYRGSIEDVNAVVDIINGVN